MVYIYFDTLGKAGGYKMINAIRSCSLSRTYHLVTARFNERHIERRHSTRRIKRHIAGQQPSYRYDVAYSFHHPPAKAGGYKMLGAIRSYSLSRIYHLVTARFNERRIERRRSARHSTRRIKAHIAGQQPPYRCDVPPFTIRQLKQAVTRC